MKKYIRNITTSIICFLIVIIINFALPRLLPGNPVAYLTGMDETSLTDAKYEYYENELHLKDSLPKQFGYYLGSLTDGSLGFSYKKNSVVSELIGERLKNTLQICLSASVISALLGMVFGLSAGYKKDSLQERIGTKAQILLNSVPTFVIALVLIIVCCFKNRWLPYSGLNSAGIYKGSAGFFADRLKHLLLPVLTLVIAQTPSRYLLVRNAAAASLSEKYVLYAKQRGLSDRKIKYSYILKNIAPPYVSMVGTGISASLGGSVIVESIFSVNGMGRLLSEAVYSLDYPLMQGILFVTALIMVISIIAADIICILLDPASTGGVYEE